MQTTGVSCFKQVAVLVFNDTIVCDVSTRSLMKNVMGFQNQLEL